MKLQKGIPTLIIVVLIGLFIGALVYIKDLNREINQLKQTVTSLTESFSRIEKERDNYVDQWNKEQFTWHSNLAKAYARSRMYEEAIQSYEKALVINPKDPSIYYQMALIYDEQLDRPDKAIEYYQKYLELTPADAPDRDKGEMLIVNCRKRIEQNTNKDK